MRSFLLVALIGLPAAAQPVPGSCDYGVAQADLDVGDVAARVFNTGTLFYGNQTNGDGYLVPRGRGVSPLYAASFWVGGRVDGELRVAAAAYENFNFWPGPIGDDAVLPNPADCSAFDRIYSVSRGDIAATVAGNLVQDVVQWPAGLGAPVIDGDGVAGNYDFAAGDRPDIVADQALFWVMNDVGGPHTAIGTPPLGIEVRVLAFAYDRADALGQATFYRYTIVSKNPDEITDAYVSVFADPDLGDFADDYLGSDPERGLGYVYNGAPTDAQYGIPPAIGFDILQGPTVTTDGVTRALGATAVTAFLPGCASCRSGPQTAVNLYNSMQGLWDDGSVIRVRGDGYNEPENIPITTFMFPGDPVMGQPWNEFDTRSAESNPPGDRRFQISTGPFTLERDTPQEIVFGIVFAQGTDRLSSITALRAADGLAQLTFDSGFNPPPVAGEETPQSASEVRVSPNPFITEARISGLDGTDVRAVLLDVLGRQVAVVHDGPLSGSLRVSGARLAPGVYLLRVQSEAGAQTVRLVRQ